MGTSNDNSTTKADPTPKTRVHSPKRKLSVKAAASKRPKAATTDTVTSRTAMIAEAAYYKAETRNFEPGREADDWLEAERDIEARLCG